MAICQKTCKSSKISQSKALSTTAKVCCPAVRATCGVISYSWSNLCGQGSAARFKIHTRYSHPIPPLRFSESAIHSWLCLPDSLSSLVKWGNVRMHWTAVAAESCLLLVTEKSWWAAYDEVRMLCTHHSTHMQDAPDKHGAAERSPTHDENTGQWESTAAIYNARLKFKGRRRIWPAWNVVRRGEIVGRRAAVYKVHAVSWMHNSGPFISSMQLCNSPRHPMDEALHKSAQSQQHQPFRRRVLGPAANPIIWNFSSSGVACTSPFWPISGRQPSAKDSTRNVNPFSLH
jgi:hypothetical protein